jgi:hypothetical protein
VAVQLGRSRRARVTFALALCWGAAANLRAQSAPKTDPNLVWKLEETSSGFCLQFLIDPTKAGEDLPDKAILIPAAQAGELHPAISRLITDEAQYARWIPSVVCSYFFGAVTVDGHRVEKGKKSMPAIAWWGVLARSPSDTAPVFALRFLATNNFHVQKPTQVAKVNMEALDLTIDSVPETGDDRYTLKYGKTLVIFDGHAAPDTTLRAATVSQTWWAEGDASTVWHAWADLHPSATHGLVGALRVQGKGDLADLLRASPIRLVGPIYSGGDGEVNFFRR